MRMSRILGLLLCLTFAGTLHAQRDLEVGNDAPGLDIDEWINTPEITIAPGRNYLLYFWSIDCKLCRDQMSLLMALHELYGSQYLPIIAINSDDEVEAVRRFVRRNEIKFAVAVDRRSSTKRAWFDAAGLEDDKPRHAIMVDHEGKVAHFGDPASDFFMEKMMPALMAGRYDEVAYRKGAPFLAAAKKSREVRNWRQAETHYSSVIKLNPRAFPLVALEIFEMKVVDMKDREAAYKYAREVFVEKYYSEDDGALGGLAQFIATEPKMAEADRDMEFALELATESNRIADPIDRPTSLSNLAAVKFKLGKTDEAIKLQRKAYFQARPFNKDKFKRTLKEYQTAKRRKAKLGD